MRLNEDAILDSIKSMSNHLTSRHLIKIGNKVDNQPDPTVCSPDGDQNSVINFNRITEGLTLQYAVWLDTLLSRNFHSSSLSSDTFRAVYDCGHNIDFRTSLDVMDSIASWLTHIDQDYDLEDKLQSSVLKRYIDRRWDGNTSFPYITVLVTPFLERLQDMSETDDLVACWSDLYQAATFLKRLPLVGQGLEEEALQNWIVIDSTLPNSNFTCLESLVLSDWFSAAFPDTCTWGMTLSTGLEQSPSEVSLHFKRSGRTWGLILLSDSWNQESASGKKLNLKLASIVAP